MVTIISLISSVILIIKMIEITNNVIYLLGRIKCYQTRINIFEIEGTIMFPTESNLTPQKFRYRKWSRELIRFIFHHLIAIDRAFFRRELQNIV